MKRKKRPADTTDVANFSRSRRASRSATACLIGLAVLTGSCASLPWQTSKSEISRAERLEILRRAQVWAPTDVASMDLKTGPVGPGAFALGETVRCDYVERDMNGRSPKFICIIPGKEPDEVKVKYGVGNAEVYGEVMATRLLWALGFGADRMYPVRVICRGCPASITAGQLLPSGERLFDPAVIERKAAGREIESRPNQGWSWPELELVDASVGGAPRAHLDALKLLAVMMTHTDSKAAQQRLVCLDPRPAPGATTEKPCAQPFMLIQDVGLTFGKPDLIYRKVNYVNRSRWSSTRVWLGTDGCTGNVKKPFLGTLYQPQISEGGRSFLASLLNQLTDSQIRDLFETARVSLRSGPQEREVSAVTNVDGWVSVFKRKREEVSARRCPAEPAAGK